jgi:hypothetical protein
MNENLSSNNIDTDNVNLNTQEIDYQNLISRLKEISAKISLIEKKYLDKF